jgi:dTDP-glucose 4,6-dehydratase
MIKFLVTGGLGFIGSIFIRYVLTTPKYKNIQVINLDSITYAGHPENLEDLADNPRYEFVKGSILNYDLVRHLLRTGVTHVINFAAESHVDRSISNPNIFTETNIIGTQTLLNAVRTIPSIERFVQVSTDEVYGSLELEEPPFTEDSLLKPSSPYSSSKCAADLLALSYHRTYGTPVVVTRCSNNFGPYQHPEKLIPLMIAKINRKEKMPVYGDGSNIRDWIYVIDHCRGLLDALFKGDNGKTFNFGGGAEVTNLEVVKLLIEEMGASEDLIQFVPDRLGHDFRYAIDYSLATKVLGWRPKHKFRESLRYTIEWYLGHLDWIQRVTQTP